MNWRQDVPPYIQAVASAVSVQPQIDWNYIDSIDANDLFLSQDKYVMREITTQFLGATYFTVQDPTRLLKLFQLLQVIVKNLTDSVQKFKKIAKSKIKENEELKSKCAKSKSKGARGVQCPICQKMFTSLQYVDSHVFARHPERATVWQALRTPQYHGLTKTYDPLTSEAYLKKMLEKMSEEFSHETKSSELDLQLYFKKQLHKMKKEMKKKSKKKQDPGEPDPPKQKKKKEDVDTFVLPILEEEEEPPKPAKEEEESEEEGEVQVIVNHPYIPLKEVQQEPVRESQKVFLLSDSHVSDVVPTNTPGTEVGPSVLVMPVSSSSNVGLHSSSMENVNLQSWKPTNQVDAVQTIEEPTNGLDPDPAVQTNGARPAYSSSDIEDGIYF